MPSGSGPVIAGSADDIQARPGRCHCDDLSATLCFETVPAERTILMRSLVIHASAALTAIAALTWGASFAPAQTPAIDLDRLCRESRVANFKRPRGYLYLEALPWSPAGKLLRRELRAMAARARGREGTLSFDDLSPDGGATAARS